MPLRLLPLNKLLGLRELSSRNWGRAGQMPIYIFYMSQDLKGPNCSFEELTEVRINDGERQKLGVVKRA